MLTMLPRRLLPPPSCTFEIISFGKRSSTTQTDGSARWRAAAAKRDRSAPAGEQRRSNGGYENESIDFNRARKVQI